jgi:hypothetical protein
MSNNLPPGGDCDLNWRTASRVHRKGATRFVLTAFRNADTGSSSMGTAGAPTPAF